MKHLVLKMFFVCTITNFIDSWNLAPQARIWNGTKISPSDYKFFASLSKLEKYNGEDWHSICGGSVISKEWILTAAHCINKAEKINVTTGQFHTPAAAWYGHPAFVHQADDFDTMDVALIRIPVQEDTRMNPLVTLSLPAPGQEVRFIDTGENVTIIGRGISRLSPFFPFTDASSTGAQKVVGEMSHFRCNVDVDSIPDARGLCIRIESPAAYLICPGDSGGPVFVRDNQADVLFAITTGIRYWCNIPGSRRLAHTGEAGFAIIHRVSAQISWVLHKVDAVSEKHSLELTMNQWMPVDIMSDVFP